MIDRMKEKRAARKARYWHRRQGVKGEEEENWATSVWNTEDGHGVHARSAVSKPLYESITVMFST